MKKKKRERREVGNATGTRVSALRTLHGYNLGPYINFHYIK